jgi:phospholipid N-methyltransferase
MSESIAARLARFMHKSPGDMLKAVAATLSARAATGTSPTTHDWSSVANYIPFAETAAKARAAGMSIGDYIERPKPGEITPTQMTIDKLAEWGVFSTQPIKTIVEIGPGSGRYLEATLRLCKPSRCEIYETAADWAAFIVREYGAICQPTDGSSLAATLDASADLVQAHKVFCTIPFLETIRYWREMVRVTRPGGFIVFDIMTEACLSPSIFAAWAKSGSRNGSSYPAAFPGESAIAYFASERCTLVGRFCVPMGPGQTDVFAFRKSL